jgi:hypothetical protein
MVMKKMLQQYNKQKMPNLPITEEKVKELIIDSMIELNLVPKVQKRKAISLE